MLFDQAILLQQPIDRPTWIEKKMDVQGSSLRIIYYRKNGEETICINKKLFKANKYLTIEYYVSIFFKKNLFMYAYEKMSCIMN